MGYTSAGWLPGRLLFESVNFFLAIRFYRDNSSCAPKLNNMAKSKSLAKQIAELEEPVPRGVFYIPLT